ncbi:MAG: histidine kinase dimerization/phospho-acceptor domain-containing protein [Bacteroidota bacterium]
MNTSPSLMQSLRELPAKYPAVLSGYIIYLYLFIVMIRFFVVARTSTIDYYDVIEMFDALPFMWLLAMMLVKVINVRTQLHESETQRIMKEQELQIKETQIGTMREVVRGLQHQINNPLAIILLMVHRMKRSPLTLDDSTSINTIEMESQRINQALKDFSETQEYETEQIGKTLGAMAVPGKS